MANFCLALSLSLVLLSIQPWQAFAKEKNVFVVGHVYCDQCLNHNRTNNAIFLKGASIFIKCKDPERYHWKTIMATTNEKGYFQAQLHGDFNPTCYAHIKSSPSTLCNAKGLNMKKSSDFEFSYSSDNNVTYSLGEFTFTPSILPSLCQQSTIHGNGNVSQNIPKPPLYGPTSSTPPLDGKKIQKPPKPLLHGTKPPKPPCKSPKPPLHGTKPPKPPCKPPKPPLHGTKPPKPPCKPPKPPLHGIKPPKPPLHGTKPPKPPCKPPKPPLHGIKPPKPPLHGTKPPKPPCQPPKPKPRHSKKELHKPKTPKPPSNGVKPPKSPTGPIKNPPLHGSKPHKHHTHHKDHC